MWIFRKNVDDTTPDLELIAQFRKQGANKCLDILFHRYAHLVFGICMKYLKDEDEAKDATITVFGNLVEDLKKFEIKNFGPWIHSVARNYCLMHLRKQKSLLKHKDDVVDMYELNNEVEDWESMLEKEGKLKLLTEAITGLNEEQRACVELFYLNERCYSEVAAITGYTMNQVKSFIQNGKRNIKIYLLKHHEKQAH